MAKAGKIFYSKEKEEEEEEEEEEVKERSL
jgi:hypothetical protein